MDDPELLAPAPSGPVEEGAIYPIAKIVFPGVLNMLFRIRSVGLENVPLDGPVVLAANHVSPFDSMVMAVATYRTRAPRFLSATYFFNKPVRGRLLRSIRQIPIRRGGLNRDALVAAEEALREGALIGIHPEGRLGDGVTMGRGRTGAARMALATKAKVVPVGIWGTQKRWPRGGIRWEMPLRPTVVMVFGEPIQAEGEPTMKDARKLTDEVMARVEELTAEARRIDEDAARRRSDESPKDR